MYSFKSSPLITEQPKQGRRRVRASRRGGRGEESFAVANPFVTGEQENYLPGELMQQI